MKTFLDLCKSKQKNLKKSLASELRKYGYNPIVDDGFVFAEGKNVDVALTAHLDTVHKELPKQIVIEKGRVSSLQGIGGDDRCGIFIILSILYRTQLRPTILFCEDEETGCKGAKKFTKSAYIKKLDKMKFIVQIDRRGNNDAVFYDCDNPDFTNFIEEITGYKEQLGTFTDICEIAPACGVAAVNLSCGYYNEHTFSEYVVMSEMEATTKVVEKLLESAKGDGIKQFEYIEVKYSAGAWGWFSNDIYGDDEITGMYIHAIDHSGLIVEDCVNCISEDEGFGFFLRRHPYLTFNNITEYEVW